MKSRYLIAVGAVLPAVVGVMPTVSPEIPPTVLTPAGKAPGLPPLPAGPAKP